MIIDLKTFLFATVMHLKVIKKKENTYAVNEKRTANILWKNFEV